MVKHGMSRGAARRHRWTAALLGVVIGFPVVLVQSTAVHVAAALTTTDIRLDVVAARDSSLRPPRGDDPCAPYRGMKLLTPFAEVGAPTGCALSRNDAGAHVTLGSTTVTDTHILATDIGATVTGTGIPPGATVASAIPGVSFELSDAGTSSATGSIHLARSTPAPFTYHWLINLDNTGDPHQPSTAAGIDPGDTTVDGSDVCRPYNATTNPDGDPDFPANCYWPSIHSVQASPVITQGDSTDWNLNGSIGNAMRNLPAGKYLVSVSADGYEIGGAHFTMPLPIAAAGPGVITVGLNPYPIPLGTIQVKVFQDQAPADGTFDQTTEHGLEGWIAKIEDILPGNVASNWFGDPICSEYQREVPAGLLALTPPAPPFNPMSPTEALAFYGSGGPGSADAKAYYSAGDPNYVFTLTDFYTWGVALVDGAPQRIPGTGGRCLSDADGIVRIPDMGTNRYSITVSPPNDSANEGRWAQTTTLEGAHDSDFWLMSNDSGLDTEMVQAGEPVPWAQFGFVDTWNGDVAGHKLAGHPVWPLTSDATKHGEIKGTVMAAEPYVPGQGGLPGQGGANGQSGIRYPHTLDRVMIGLNDFDNGDLTGYVTQNNSDGTFDIQHVKDGTYLMSFWDIDQDYAFDAFNVSIVGGQLVDLGNVPLIGWFTRVKGKVFIDTNSNGKLDPGERGVPNFDVTMKNRTNDMMVSGQNVATSDFLGNYEFKEAYPAGSFVIEEFFNTRYKTTGVTYQADNDPNAHTVLTAAVDLSVLPIIGQDGRVDIGVLPYDTTAKPCADTCQGGIVATVVYDATRNELQAGKAATESYEPGIPGIPVNIALPVKCGTDAGVECDEHGRYELNADGSYATHAVTVGPDTSFDLAPGNVSDSSATYVTEDWHRPDSCVPRDSNGNIVQQTAIQTTTANRTPHDCIEATELATTFGFADGDVGATDGQQVDGNYGFVTNHPGDYVVSVDIPDDPIFHRPLYKMRDEAPINVFTGDVYVPQDSDLKSTTFQSFLKFNRADPTVPQLTGPGLREADSTASPYVDSKCIGPLKTIYANDPIGHPDTYNPDLHNTGGSPSEGMEVNDCSMKLIHVEPGQSVAPNFNLWTDVPIPAKFWGYVTDDVSVSTDRRSTALGEVQGVANVPVGLYDWTNRLIYETDTDYNGLFEVLMPSTNSYNCPVPAGPCSGMYRFVGNDPGQPQHPNMNYNPVYKTIAANFQAWPGIFTSADTAPTRVMVQIEGPASQFAAVAICKAADTDPQIFHVDWPFAPNPNTYTPNNGEATGRIEVYGNGFGATTGSVSLTPVDIGTSPPAGSVSVSNWSNTHFTLTLQLTGGSSVAGGAYQLQVTNSAGSTTVNGLTIHVLKSNYTTVASGNSLTLQARFPDVAHVGPISKLRLLDNGANQLAPNAPYTNWGETNRANMFTPTDPSKFFFPGPIQKAINYEWNRWLNVGPLLTAVVNALFPVHNEAWALAMQAAGNSALNQIGSPHKHPLIMVYPRLDQDPVTGAPAIDPVTHAPSFDPNDPALAFNANGAYYESPVMYYPFKLQGTGPGGIYPDLTGGATGPTPAYGSVIDGQYFNAATNKAEPSTSDQPDGTDPFTYDPSLFAEPYAALWENFVVFQLGQGATVTDPTIPAAPNPMPTWFGYGWDGQQAPTEGEVVYVVAHNGDYGTAASHAFRASVDGLTVTGGDQLGFPGNRNEVGGGAIANAPGETGTAPDENFVLDIQGGAMMVNAFARYLQITNNSVIANSGASGAIRIGTPQLGTDTEDGNPETDPATGETFPAYDQQNTDLHLAYNRVVGDGGTSLGGALAIFNGSERYRVDHNQFCGNFSAEYGGAISHFGLSKNGEIDHNKIYLNESVDEGAGIMIGGEPQLDAATAIPIPGKLSNGSGPVSIHDNYIAANLAGDDGGGLRFLQAGNWQADVYNNMITDNVSTHEGGGIALDDSTNVRIFNNTVAKNITTATAVTSTGAPAPAGLSTGDNSTPLMDCVVTNVTYSHTNGRTTNGSATFTLPNNTPAANRFTAADLGATLVQAAHLPAGSKITSVAANGLSVQVNTAAVGAATNLTYSVYRACQGMPPQAAAPASFSNPLLFNDLFDDNRAGNWQSTGTTPGVHGVGLVTGEVINEWDMGSADGAGVLSPTNSVINSINGYNPSPTNIVHTEVVHQGDLPSAHNYAKFVSPFDISVSISPWRVNPRFRPAAIVGVSLPPNAIGDYHLLDATSPAANSGATSKAIPPFSPPTVNAPSTDIDNDPRGAPIDIGADEVRTPTADLTVTKTHSPAGSVAFGAAVTYTVTVHNNGPDTAAGAPVTDNFPAGVTVTNWTCTATVGSSCTTSGSGNSRAGTVTLINGGTATFTATTTASPVSKPLPAIATLDPFTRANANTLGANWTQPVNGSTAAIKVNTNQALCSGSLIPLVVCATGPAYWNPATFGPKQGAAFSFASTPTTGSELLMAVSGSPTGNVYPNGVRVQYASGSPSTITNTASVAAPAGMVDPNTANNSQSDNLNLTGNRVLVSWTTASGLPFNDLGAVGIPTGAFANGNTLEAVINTDGTVDVWKINGGTTYLGSVGGLPASFTTGASRVGMLLPNNQRVDDFKGATVP